MKKCSKCKEIKDNSAFSVRKDRRQGKALHSACKECQNKYSKVFAHTSQGLLNRIYFNQRENSRRRGMPPPSYSREEFHAQYKKDPLFIEMFKRWKNSNYEYWKTPSFDRIDFTKPYTFDNVIIVDWETNRKKGDKENGERRCKPLLMYEMDGTFTKKFNSSKEAMQYFQIKNLTIGSIGQCCKGRKKSAYGHIWKFEGEQNA